MYNSVDISSQNIIESLSNKLNLGESYFVNIAQSHQITFAKVINKYNKVVALGVVMPSPSIEAFSDTVLQEFENTSLLFTYDLEELAFYRRSFANLSIDHLSTKLSFGVSTESSLLSILKPVPLGNNLETILFEAHSHLRDIDGLHSDSALDEICKLLFAKIYDEHQSETLFKSDYANIDETAMMIRELHKKSHLSVLGSDASDSSSALSENIKLSSAAISKVVSEFEKVDLVNSPVDIKGRAFQNLISPALRSGMGQYFTPKEVIELIIDCMAPLEHESIIDPFCGSAHFLTESVKQISKNGSTKLHKYIKNKLFGIDKSQRMIRISLTDMLLMDGVAPTLINKDSLLDFQSLNSINESSFDIVMTNPPFGSMLTKDAFDSLGFFELLHKRASLPLEIAGLERSIQLLKPSGRLAIVLPDSILLNKNLQYVRDWLSKNVQIKAIISLPSETFSPYGANVKTSVIIMVKRKPPQNYQVFMSTIKNIGYDASGRIAKQQSDMYDVSEKFSSFIKAEGW